MKFLKRISMPKFKSPVWFAVEGALGILLLTVVMYLAIDLTYCIFVKLGATERLAKTAAVPLGILWPITLVAIADEIRRRIFKD